MNLNPRDKFRELNPLKEVITKSILQMIHTNIRRPIDFQLGNSGNNTSYWRLLTEKENSMEAITVMLEEFWWRIEG